MADPFFFSLGQACGPFSVGVGMTKTIIYASQFDGYWRLTEEQLKACLRTGAAGEGFTLPEQMLAGRPAAIGSERYEDTSSLYVKTRYADRVRLYQMLDWEQDAFRDELDRIVREGV